MKSFELLLTPNDCRKFLDTHLRTDAFRQAIQAQPELNSLMEAFCRFPRVAFTATDNVTERSNFTAWYNALAVRNYLNPAVNDLYYLHEIAHVVTMTYARGMNFVAWKTKLFANELEASVLSESYIYLLCPELRAQAFVGEIWVDRYLPALREKPRPDALAFLRRERARLQAADDLRDPQETRIREYQSQNEKWAALWRERYDVVESHMVRFYESARTEPAMALRGHVQWLKQQIAESGEDKPYPFAKEVDEFARLTALTKSPAPKETAMV